MEFIFWAALVFVLYTYAGYPLAVWMLSQLRPNVVSDPTSVMYWPSVCIIVPVYNEQERVLRKINNLRALDYPRDWLQIIFVSDGSTDDTHACIVAEPDVKLIAYAGRRGKPHALNTAVLVTEAEILVLTDVRQEIAQDALRQLVARLLMPGIGAVSGELIHVDPQTHEAAHIGLYWRYEKWIRKSESRLYSTLGVTGALYAIRRCDYTPLPQDTLLDDFVIPMEIVRRGGRAVLESRARVYDELQKHVAGERRRKVRTLSGNFQVFARYPWLFSPRRNPVFVPFVSHKVFRLAVPYALALLFISPLFLEGAFYTFAAICQGLFYSVAGLGLWLPALRAQRFIGLSVVFLELNWAAVLALGQFLSGRLDARWEKT